MSTSSPFLEKKIEIWKNKLMDLSFRNPLIAFKSHTAISLWESSSEIFNSLHSNEYRFQVESLPISLSGGIKFLEIHPKQEENINKQEEKQLEYQVTQETHVSEKKKRLFYQEEDAFLLKKIEKKLRGQSVFLDDNHCLFVDGEMKFIDNKLSRMKKLAKEKEEESGIHILFVTCGELIWTTEDDKEIHSPLILIPVSLEKKTVKNSTKKEIYEIYRHEDDIILNPALCTLFEEKYQILLDEEIENRSLNDILTNIQEKVKSFAVVKSTSFLGLFSYAKHHMWKDLETKIDKIKNHSFLQKIVGFSDKEQEISFLPWKKLDEDYIQNELYLPLPYDSSQVKAIERVDRGEHLIIQGPPGTGKSQTIANLIAHLMAKGKRVLFVAEKLTALNVVYEKLRALKLDPFCLELHTQNSTKKQVLNQLQKGLNVFHEEENLEKKYQESLQKIIQLKKNLNNGLDEIHKVYPNGLSIYKAIGISVTQKEQKENEEDFLLETFIVPSILEETYEKKIKREDVFQNYIHALELMSPKAHTFTLWTNLLNYEDSFIWLSLEQLISFLGNLHLLAFDFCGNRLIWEKKSLSYLEKMAKNCQIFANFSELDNDDYQLALSSSFIEKINKWQNLDKQISQKWLPYSSFISKESLNQDDLWENGEKILSLSFLFFGKKIMWYNKLKKVCVQKVKPDIHILKNWFKDRKLLQSLYKERQEIMTDIFQIFLNKKEIMSDKNKSDKDKIKTKIYQIYQLSQKLDWSLNEKEMKEWFQFIIDKNQTKIFMQADVIIDNCQKIKERLTTIGLYIKAHITDPVYNWEDVSIEKIQEMTYFWMGLKSFYPQWKNYNQIRQEALSLDLMPFILYEEKYRDKAYSAQMYRNKLENVYAKYFIQSARLSHPEYLNFQGISREDGIHSFQKKTTEIDDLVVDFIHKKLSERIKKYLMEKNDEYKIFSREMLKKTKQMSVRKLFRNIPHLVSAVKPCLLMSPASVSEYLSDEISDFDVVIFDESSQITTADSIGSILRSHQVVIVGDSKQMPPSRLFYTDDDTEDDTNFDDMDSILTEGLSTGFPSVMLNWHYRSRNERLIEFSNKTYYGGNLMTFPNSSISHSDFKIHQVNGLYDRGGSGTNRAEADAIIQRLIEHVESSSSLSIGVITFNQKQQQLIERLWETTLKEKTHWSDRKMSDIMIKNLENIQGDERDIILFSTTFGKDVEGKFLLNFGPLGQVGGERRLNVAITRAKESMEIFTSFSPYDIDEERLSHQGVKDLRNWLLFIQNKENKGNLVIEKTLPENSFELSVANALIQKGWKICPQVGQSGYRIDLGVYHPTENRFIAGIECDGAMYHSSKISRDRDFQRQTVLENLGWTLIRVWSTNWFENTSQELERIHKKLQNLV